MKKFPLVLFCLLIAGCAPSSDDHGTSLDINLQNPLYAERYWEGLTDRMVEFEIRKDPLLEDENMKTKIDDVRVMALKNAQEARKLQRGGRQGLFVRVGEYTEGEVLYLDDTIYFSSTFDADPGPNMHVYITSAVDPTGVEFPDETSVRLGKLESAFGAQQYAVPPTRSETPINTVVLYDRDLERIHGFAQLK